MKTTRTTKIVTLLTALIIIVSVLLAFGRDTALASFVQNAWQGYKLTSGLVGYWSFDGRDIDTSQVTAEVRDASGSGNHGNWLEHATTTTIGKVGQAVSFDGVDDYIAAPDISAVDSATNLTLVGWVKRRALSSHISVGKAEVQARRFDFNFYNDGNVYVNVGDGATSNYGYFPSNDTNWHFIAFAYDGSLTGDANRAKVYFDGEQKTLTFVGTIPSATQPSPDMFAIGKNSVLTTYSAGAIDEVRLYNRTLSPDEIKRLYQMGASAKVNVSHRDELTSGLVGYWTFDGKDMDLASSTREFFDRSGQANNGDWRNHASTTVIGKIGQAIDLDGANDFVTMGDINIMDGVTRMTVSAWVRTSKTGEAHAVDKSTCDGNVDAGVFELGANFVTQNKASFTLYKNGGSPSYYVAESATSITDDKWHHAVGVYDGNDLRVYIDGKDDGSTSAPGITLPSNSTSFEVGGNCNGNANPYEWEGDVDDVRYYSRVLTPDEIKRLYLMGASTKINVSHRDELTSGLVGYWTFDGKDMNISSSTKEVYDLSGNGSHVDWKNHATTTTIGKVGQAIFLDDNDDYLENLSVNSVLNITGDITVSAWIKRSAASIGTYGGIFAKAIDNVSADYELYINGSPVGGTADLVGFWTSAGGGQNTLSNTAITDTNWHHVLFTRSGGTSAIYLDGIADGGSGITNTFTNDTSRVTIGTDGPVYLSGASNFGGAIDEVRVYNRAFTADEIKRLYLMGK